MNLPLHQLIFKICSEVLFNLFSDLIACAKLVHVFWKLIQRLSISYLKCACEYEISFIELSLLIYSLETIENECIVYKIQNTVNANLSTLKCKERLDSIVLDRKIEMSVI